MSVPLVISEACVKINERIQEVMSELKVKASKYPENSEERSILLSCTSKLNDLNNEIYERIFNQFMSTMIKTTVPKSQIASEAEAQEECN